MVREVSVLNPGGTPVFRPLPFREDSLTMRRIDRRLGLYPVSMIRCMLSISIMYCIMIEPFLGLYVFL